MKAGKREVPPTVAEVVNAFVTSSAGDNVISIADGIRAVKDRARLCEHTDQEIAELIAFAAGRCSRATDD